ncbi:hypothetical protein [Glutamicibacter endophyticus]|uniref:hypothetical protein n=1 Tax=Glutamicibacter endophyticus TaxID=1522174 RepID=UPI003AEFDFF3
MASLVSLLSGRDFETRSYSEELARESFAQLESVLREIVNKYNFQQFIQTIKSAGFTQPRLIGSTNALNFAYALFLRLRAEKQLGPGEIRSVVRRWYVMSLLTGRQSGSFETVFESDLRRINDLGVVPYLEEIERGRLTEGFWDVELPSNLDTTSTRSPYFSIFLAAQVQRNAKGFLSKHVTVAQMLEDGGDIHHLVPKNYLVKSGIKDKALYNQIANFALTETHVNIAISDTDPSVYVSQVENQIASGRLTLGEITTADELANAFSENAIPTSLSETTAANYQSFLVERRIAMAKYIREYYAHL